MYCPRCKAEYREGFTQCADCRVPLVSALPEPPQPPDPNALLDLVTVLECSNSVSMSLAQGTLDDAGIPYVINGLAFGPNLEYRPSIADIPCRIQVAGDRADQARELLAPLGE
jgi:hypothetical protein